MKSSPLSDVAQSTNGNVAMLPVGTLPVGNKSVAKNRLGDRVRSLLSSLHSADCRGSRRREQRFPYPCLLRMTPYDEDTAPSDFEEGYGDDFDGYRMADATTVVGHEISLAGIGFYHQEPITDRLVVIELSDDRPASSPLRVLVDLSWCRFAREGWYESGGRMVRELS